MMRRSLTGETAQYDAPVWEPLLEVVGDDLIDGWMWMHEIELEDGTRLHAYKHRDTRRYVHLDADGNAYDYHHEPTRDGGYGTSWYTQIPTVYALAGAMWRWPLIGAEADDLEALERAIVDLHQRRAAA